MAADGDQASWRPARQHRASRSPSSWPSSTDVGPPLDAGRGESAGVVVADNQRSRRCTSTGSQPSARSRSSSGSRFGSRAQHAARSSCRRSCCSASPSLADHAAADGRRGVPLTRAPRRSTAALADTRTRSASQSSVEGAAWLSRRWSPERSATDFILSTEIMVIALNEVADEPFISRAADPGDRGDRHHRRWLRDRRPDREDGRRRGLLLSQRSVGGRRRRSAWRLVRAMPRLLSVISRRRHAPR